MTNLPTYTDEKAFKEAHRKDMCTSCPKRVPCGYFDGICELIVPCAVCEIKDICTSLCEQMEAYLIRGKDWSQKAIPFSRLKNPASKDVDYSDSNSSNAHSVEDWVTYKNIQFKQSEESVGHRDKLSLQDIPWPAISDRDAKIVFDHFYFDKTFEELATQFNMAPSSVYEIVHGGKTSHGALKKLRDYAKYRDLFRKNEDKVPDNIKTFLKLFYMEYKEPKEIAELEKCSEAWVSTQLNNGKKFLDSL